MSVFVSGVVDAVYTAGGPSPPQSPTATSQLPEATRILSPGFSMMTDMEEGVSDAWSSLWSLVHSPLMLENGAESDDDVEDREKLKLEYISVVKIQALIRGFLARRTVTSLWAAAAGELARRLKKRLARGESLLSAEGDVEGGVQSCVLWVIESKAQNPPNEHKDPNSRKTFLEVTGLKMKLKPMDLSTLAFAHCAGNTVSLKFIGRKSRLEFMAASEADAAILGASLELISVWSGSTKPRYNQQRTSHFLVLLSQCPNWLARRKGCSFTGVATKSGESSIHL
mmetsp:Transcript_49053/g.62963  ORF Transcript_49053/g.62963 Transcript_49053/m.62963 type:complete len:283 (-) Transcript_49053:213-1061(-)